MINSPDLERLAAELGIDLPSADAVRGALEHLELLYRWNARVNLTSIREPHEGLRRHVLESLAGVELLPPADRPGAPRQLVDIGSGNGFPAVPLLLARPELSGVLVESSGKKAAFLRALIRHLDIGSRVAVLERRVRESGDLPRDWDVLTFRALPDPERWAEAALRTGRRMFLLAWLSRSDAARIAAALQTAGFPAEQHPLPTHPSGAILAAHSGSRGDQQAELTK